MNATAGSDLIPPSRPFAPSPRNSMSSSPPISPVRIGTPLSNKLSSSQPYSSTIPERDTTRRRLAVETIGMFVGPMPCEQFLATFLPHEPSQVPPLVTRETFRKVASQSREELMYTPFISAAKAFTPHLVLVDTHRHPDTKCDALSPDVSIYLPSVSRDRETDFSKMEMWVEFKHNQGKDAFKDSVDPQEPQNDDFRFERTAGESVLTKGQLCSYAAAQLGTQFRLYAFSLQIFGPIARFIRWDRGGAIVSSAFDYLEHPQLLAQFLWRYDQNPGIRGNDPSVTIPSRDEVDQAKARVGTHWKISDGDTFFKVKVPEANDMLAFRWYIIPSPKSSPRSPFGRATRASVAYDILGDTTVFLKDSWRVDEPGMQKEGDIYKLLQQQSVPHVAPFGAGNDISDHVTVTQMFATKKWACWTKKLSCHRHYRMTLNTIGRNLTSFNSSLGYVNAIADGMEAHQYAYYDAGILHRDISVGNIIITNDGEGLLIDWDLSVNLNSVPPHARRPGRTGTWQFISAALLLDNAKLHEVADDWESSLHLLTWIALRYTAHTKMVPLSTLLDPFDEVSDAGNGVYGGSLKKLQLMEQQISKTVEFTDRPRLNALIETLTNAFAVRYESKPTDADWERLDKLLRLEGMSEDYLVREATFQYRKRMAFLDTRSWLVDTFRSHLADREVWPMADQAVAQFVGAERPAASNTKHFSDQAKIESGVCRW